VKVAATATLGVPQRSGYSNQRCAQGFSQYREIASHPADRYIAIESTSTLFVVTGSDDDEGALRQRPALRCVR
jgi:hypothetical protein